MLVSSQNVLGTFSIENLEVIQKIIKILFFECDIEVIHKLFKMLFIEHINQYKIAMFEFYFKKHKFSSMIK